MLPRSTTDHENGRTIPLLGGTRVVDQERTHPGALRHPSREGIFRGARTHVIMILGFQDSVPLGFKA